MEVNKGDIKVLDDFKIILVENKVYKIIYVRKYTQCNECDLQVESSNPFLSCGVKYLSNNSKHTLCSIFMPETIPGTVIFKKIKVSLYINQYIMKRYGKR